MLTTGQLYNTRSTIECIRGVVPYDALVVFLGYDKKIFYNEINHAQALRYIVKMLYIDKVYEYCTWVSDEARFDYILGTLLH